jgi:hypothetical protein
VESKEDPPQKYKHQAYDLQIQRDCSDPRNRLQPQTTHRFAARCPELFSLSDQKRLAIIEDGRISGLKFPPGSFAARWLLPVQYGAYALAVSILCLSLSSTGQSCWDLVRFLEYGPPRYRSLAVSSDGRHSLGLEPLDSSKHGYLKQMACRPYDSTTLRV